MIKKIYTYAANSTDPYQNLATEKILFDKLEKDSVILYLWQNKNTVVIGRNQNPWAECNQSAIKEDGITLARRLSGGGAVYHDLGNLNFTFIYGEENANIEKRLTVIKKACELCQIEAEVSGRNDILAGGRKFSGNAFYNSKGKGFHHGTILISVDMEKMASYLTPPKAKLVSKGVKSVKSRTVNLSELSSLATIENMKKNMIEAFEDVYGMSAEKIPPLSQAEIDSLSAEFGNWDYIYGKSVPFNISCEKYYPWGNISVQLQSEKGAIKDIKVYTDSMDWTIGEKTESALIGCRLEENDIKTALSSAIESEIADDVVSLFKEVLI